MLGFTPDEKKVVIFFLLALAVGNAVLLYKRTHPGFAPELKYRDLPGSPMTGPTAEMRSDAAGLSLMDRDVRQSDKALSGKINLNRANQADLERLPAIGPAMAKRIIDYRQTSGDFQRVEDLMKVKGIGDKKFNKLRDHVFVDH